MAQITLPETDNDGENLVGIHNTLKRALCDKFGGYTSVAATGAWVDEGKLFEEDVIVYNVAMDNSHLTIVKFEKIAKDIAQRACQIAVAITLPTGEFKLVYPPVAAPSPTHNAMDWYYGQDDGGHADA